MSLSGRAAAERVIDKLIRILWDTRTERGIAQVNVCPDMRHQKISIWEQRVNTPGLSNFVQWADALGYDVKLVPRDAPVVSPPPTTITTVWRGCVCSYTWYPSLSNESVLTHRMTRRGVPGCPYQHEDGYVDDVPTTTTAE